MGTEARSFVHEQRAVRVVFRPGALEVIAEEVDRLALRRVVLIGGRRHTARAAALLAHRVATVVEDPIMHVPVEQATAVRARAAEVSADGVVAVGGGSSVGLAKAVALTTSLPVLAVPTTFAGSEMTRVWGLTEGGAKRTGRDPVVAPRTVLYDPELVATLPPRTAVPSAFNAIAHAVEALYAPDRTPVTDLLAAEAVRVVAGALPGLSESRPAAAAEVLYGAWLAGMCLDSTTMSLHHKLCHVLGGTLGLPHAETHTVVLPHALAFNAGCAPSAMSTLQRVLEHDDPAERLHRLAVATGAPVALRDLGMSGADVDRVAGAVVSAPYANPRPITLDGVREVLRRCWSGARPLTHLS